jgi:hypothetical protein
MPMRVLYFLGPLNDPFLVFRPGPVDTILSGAVGRMGSADAPGARGTALR